MFEKDCQKKRNCLFQPSKITRFVETLCLLRSVARKSLPFQFLSFTQNQKQEKKHPTKQKLYDPISRDKGNRSIKIFKKFFFDKMKKMSFQTLLPLRAQREKTRRKKEQKHVHFWGMCKLFLRTSRFSG